MRKKNRKTRILWDGRYKPYYEITFLDELDSDTKLDEKEFTDNWWGFLDEIEAYENRV